jgi:hypothetical protein
MAIMVPCKAVGVNRPVTAIGKHRLKPRVALTLTASGVTAIHRLDDNWIMRRIAIAIGLFVFAPSCARAGCDLFDCLWFSAASPGYPAAEFWTPRLYRLHACHWPTSVSVNPQGRCDVTPGFVPVGPYCPGSQPHFPVQGPAKP